MIFLIQALSLIKVGPAPAAVKAAKHSLETVTSGKASVSIDYGGGDWEKAKAKGLFATQVSTSSGPVKVYAKSAARYEHLGIKAMAKAIKRGREKVKAGTFVDPSPSQARRIRGEVAVSACGSPATMCADSSQPGGF